MKQTIKTRSRQLRKDMTDAERVLWRTLRSRQFAGYKFRRQQPLGRYIVDFVCLERRLVIELDGGQHAEEARSEDDARRTAWLEQSGFRVRRFWNNDIFKKWEAVKEEIFRMLT